MDFQNETLLVVRLGVFIGFSGPPFGGKSTASKRVASRLGIPEIDISRDIIFPEVSEHTGIPVENFMNPRLKNTLRLQEVTPYSDRMMADDPEYWIRQLERYSSFTTASIRTRPDDNYLRRVGGKHYHVSASYETCRRRALEKGGDLPIEVWESAMERYFRDMPAEFFDGVIDNDSISQVEFEVHIDGICDEVLAVLAY